MAEFDDKTNGNTVDASEYNAIVREIKNSILDSDQTLNGADDHQVAKGMANYAAVSTFYTDSGSANIYTLTSQTNFNSPTALKNGLEIRFRPANTNTGSSTIQLPGTAAKPAKKSNKTTNVSAGDISTSRDAIYRYDSTADVWVMVQDKPEFARLTYEVSSGTSGGSNVAGAWTTREINTTSQDPSSITSLSSNQFTLQPGRYVITASQVLFSELGTLGSCAGRIYNVTDSTIVAQSLTQRLSMPSGTSAQTPITVKSFLEITSAKTFSLEYWAESVNATDGLGVPKTSGQNEVYVEIFIEKF